MDDATEHRSTAGSDGPGWSADPGTGQREGIGRRAWVRSAAMVGGGLVAGGILAGTLTANAATDDTSTSSTSSYSRQEGTSGGNGDPSQPQRSDEQLLTGDTATKVTDAVTADYPDATIQRVETDSDGVYEAHIVTADGQQMIVQVGEDFAVTGTQSHGHR
jgi:hypothetical protein